MYRAFNTTALMSVTDYLHIPQSPHPLSVIMVPELRNQ